MDVDVALVTTDETLRDRMAQVAAAVGTELTECASVGQAVARVRPGGTVLLGADQGAGAPTAHASSAAARAVRLVRIGFGSRPAGPQAGSRVLLLPWDEEEVVRLVEQARGIGGAAVHVGVIGARGGLGVSVVAAAVARWAARRVPTALVDLDLGGGGLDALLGVADAGGLRWPGLETDGAALDVDRLPAWRGVGVLSAQAGRPARLPVRVVRDAVEHLSGQVGVLVLDLARGPGAVDPVRAAAWCDHVVLLAGREERSVAGALGLLPALGAAGRVHLVACAPAPAAMTPGELAGRLGLPGAVGMRRERSLEGDLEHGGGPADRRRGPVARTAAELCRALGLARATRPAPDARTVRPAPDVRELRPAPDVRDPGPFPRRAGVR